MPTIKHTVAGTYTWTPPAGTTHAQVQCWAAGGGGGNSAHATYYYSGGGGGGGEYAEESSDAVSSAHTYTIIVGAGGGAGGGGGNSSFTGTGATTVTAHGGGAGTNTGGAGAGGTGSTNAIHHNGGGGGGGAESSTSVFTGAGGGGGAGTTAAGGAGGNGGGFGPGGVGGTGGSVGGGNGGAGGAIYGGQTNGVAGYGYGGGGGGGAPPGGGGSGASGASGAVWITYTTAVTVNLTTAQLNLKAFSVQPPVILPAAQLNLASYNFTQEWALALAAAAMIEAAPAVTPKLAITLLCALAAHSGTDDSGSTFAQGFTGKTVAFQPFSSPLTFETPHNMPGMSNSWAVGAGGQAKYFLDANGNLDISFILNTIGTRTDGTILWAAGSLPNGYQVPIAKYWPVTVIGTYSYSGETPSLLFGTDGSIKIYGISANAPTSIQSHGVIPLAI